MTNQIVETTTVNKEDRKITTKYTTGAYRVSVSTTYYASRKSYVSTVRESRLEFHGDYVTEISQLNIGFGEKSPEDDYNETIQAVKVERYNFKEIQKYHAQAVEEAAETKIVTQLLIKGKTNSEIFAQKLAS
jgi:hypothetical protein